MEELVNYKSKEKRKQYTKEPRFMFIFVGWKLLGLIATIFFYAFILIGYINFQQETWLVRFVSLIIISPFVAVFWGSIKYIAHVSNLLLVREEYSLKEVFASLLKNFGKVFLYEVILFLAKVLYFIFVIKVLESDAVQNSDVANSIGYFLIILALVFYIGVNRFSFRNMFFHDHIYEPTVCNRMETLVNVFTRKANLTIDSYVMKGIFICILVPIFILNMLYFAANNPVSMMFSILFHAFAYLTMHSLLNMFDQGYYYAIEYEDIKKEIELY